MQRLLHAKIDWSVQVIPNPGAIDVARPLDRAGFEQGIATRLRSFPGPRSEPIVRRRAHTIGLRRHLRFDQMRKARRDRRRPSVESRGADASRVPASTSTRTLRNVKGRRLPRIRGAWQVQVTKFLDDKRSRDNVGEDWLVRMSWELRRLPRLLSRVGEPTRLRSPRDVTEGHLRALREKLPWETATFAVHFQALRQFLRWGRNLIANDRSLWALPKSVPVHRRWLTKAQLVALYQSARGAERVIVALEGFSGLRRVEVLRLRVKDVLVKEECLRVLGKGSRGGKWRTIPLRGEVLRILTNWIADKEEGERVIALSRSGADAALQRAAHRAGFTTAGIRVSHHDLRRTFGRLANAAGMSLISLQGLYGHASPILSAHYIGLDFDELKRALARFDQFLGTPCPSPGASHQRR